MNMNMMREWRLSWPALPSVTSFRAQPDGVATPEASSLTMLVKGSNDSTGGRTPGRAVVGAVVARMGGSDWLDRLVSFMPDDVSDAVYVERVRTGDTDAFRPLVDRYEGMVYEITTRYAVDAEDAEDLAQDVFIRAFHRIDDLREPKQFSSWLYGIALNRCRDYHENVRRQTLPFSRTENAEPEGAHSTIDSQQTLMEQEERSEALWRALDSLTPMYSVPFLMKHRDGMTYKAMADRLDVSISALKVRVHRARKKLRRFLQDENLDSLRPQ